MVARGAAPVPRGFAPLLKHDQRGNSANAEARRDFRVPIRVQLAHDHASLPGTRQLVENRRHHFARVAPVGVEVDQHRYFATADDPVEVGVTQLDRSVQQEGSATLGAFGSAGQTIQVEPVQLAAETARQSRFCHGDKCAPFRASRKAAYYASMRFNAWHDLPSGPAVPDQLNVIIEIPRGSRNKYELDKDTGLFRFDRLLYSAVYYPGDYGFVPQTLADDDDPLDVLVMVTVPTFPGCLVVVRPVGVLEIWRMRRDTTRKSWPCQCGIRSTISTRTWPMYRSIFCARSGTLLRNLQRAGRCSDQRDRLARSRRSACAHPGCLHALRQRARHWWHYRVTAS